MGILMFLKIQIQLYHILPVILHVAAEPCVEKNTDFYGNDIKRLEHIQSAHDCACKCRELAITTSPTCRYFTWVEKKKYCWLKTSNNNSEHKKGVHSGTGDCCKGTSSNEPFSAVNGSVKAWLDTVDCLDDWERNLRLGDAYLNTSAKSECARARFTLGLLSLHSFQFDLAREMFEAAEKVEKSETGRSYPMAMWGAVMASTPILKQISNCKKGKKFLKKIPKHRGWITKKEEAYIQTGYALYPNSISCTEKDDEASKARRFMKAMSLLTKKYPDEVEAKLFLTLTKFTLSIHPQGLEALFKKHPTHPGILHYTMHFFGFPEYYYQGARLFLKKGKFFSYSDHPASLGLDTATNYLKVATSSGYGLHITSHMYMRLGRWNKSLESNLLAIKAIDDLSKQRGFSDEQLYDETTLYHCIEFAQYDYLQLGQYEKAEKMLSRVNSIILKLGGAQAWNKTRNLILTQHRMYLRQLIESFSIAPSSDPFGCKMEIIRKSIIKKESEMFQHKCINGLHGSLVSKHMNDRELNLAAVSEIAMLQTYILQEILICARDRKISCYKYKVLR